MKVAYASAPPSVGNMAVGFDILGHALEAPGDQVKALRVSKPGVRMGAVTGVVNTLPSEPLSNTAGRAVHELLQDQQADFGVTLNLHKGIALGSGMGGSAASAVAAVMAANQLLAEPLQPHELLVYALAGESVASGAVHGDNVAPCMFGGIVFIPPANPQAWVQIPVPDDLHCVLMRPELRLDTASGRNLLSAQCELKSAVTQTSHLASLICACYENKIEALRGVLDDQLIESQRAGQIEGYFDVKRAALDAGALGFSLSGSGPSMIAWCQQRDSESISKMMSESLQGFYANFQHVSSPVQADGARLIKQEDWLGA